MTGNKLLPDIKKYMFGPHSRFAIGQIGDIWHVWDAEHYESNRHTSERYPGVCAEIISSGSSCEEALRKVYLLDSFLENYPGYEF